MPWLPDEHGGGDNGDQQRADEKRAPLPGGGHVARRRSHPDPSRRSSEARSPGRERSAIEARDPLRDSGRSAAPMRAAHQVAGRQRGRLDADDGGDHGGTSVADKRPASRDHLVEDACQTKRCPFVRRRRVPRSARAPCMGACPERFHRQSARGSSSAAGRGRRTPQSLSLARPKSRSFAPARRQHHVARFQVAVNDVFSVECVQRLRDLYGDDEGLIKGNRRHARDARRASHPRGAP